MVRRRYGIILMAVFAVVLAACGEEEDEAEPTAEPTSAAVSTVEEEDSAIDEIVDEDSTPTIPGTPDVMATPAVITAASPAAAPASPVVASPEAAVGAVPANTSATPASGSLIAATLSGSVVLPGMANEAYVISEDGCVGIGSFAGVEAGQQVVIRDAAGAIVGVTELAASDATDDCSWIFQLEVPESTFYSVEIPMVAQHVFTQEEVASADGEIELTLD